MGDTPVLMPSEVSERVGFFDRFAGYAAHIASRAVFFTFCVGLILLWAPSILIIRDIDTWQLIINTATTIITFLMVHIADNHRDRDLDTDVIELRKAVGLEEHESTSHNSLSKT